MMDPIFGARRARVRRPSAKRQGVAALLTLVMCGSALAACFPQPQPSDTNFQVQTVLSNLNLPTSVRFADDGRVFVAERAGRLVMFDSLDDRTPSLVADFRSEVSTMWDRGFMGIELDPDFTNGRPYVYALYSYNAPPGGTAPVWTDNCVFAGFGNNGVCGITTGRLTKIEVGPDNREASRTVLMTDWCQQFGGHSVDDLEFGSDGALYVSAGEGANFETPDWGQFHGNPCGDPPMEGGMLRAQDARTTADPTGPSGAVIRIDPDTAEAWPTNPWHGDPDPGHARVVAYGFRNPFRLHADEVSGKLYVADVGWGTWEEVNAFDLDADEVPNFGWPCFEGDDRQPTVDAAAIPLCQSLDDADVTRPSYKYSHRDSLGTGCATGGTSVTGLASVSKNSYAAPFDDGLFMADYSRQCIWFLPRTADGGFDFDDRRSFVTGAAAVDLQVGPGGDLYFVDTTAGTISRIVSTGTNHPPVARITASPLSGPAPLTVNFDAWASTDDDFDPLTMRWDLDDDGQFDDATGPLASRTFTQNGEHVVRLRVNDPAGAADVAQVVVRVGNLPPTASIALPLPGAYEPGEMVDFAGSGHDPEDGALPPSAMKWTFTIQHCDGPGSCHEHLVGEHDGLASGTFEMPAHPHPSFLDVELTVTDSAGATATALRQIEIADTGG